MIGLNTNYSYMPLVPGNHTVAAPRSKEKCLADAPLFPFSLSRALSVHRCTSFFPANFFLPVAPFFFPLRRSAFPAVSNVSRIFPKFSTEIPPSRYDERAWPFPPSPVSAVFCPPFHRPPVPPGSHSASEGIVAEDRRIRSGKEKRKDGQNEERVEGPIYRRV